ncbi:MAG: ATP-binding protein [Fuerstiella sp.]
MSDESGPRELTADEVTVPIDASQFGFRSTDELEPLDGIVGQPRALRALDVGLGVRHRNHHIYVSGLSGTGRLNLIRDAIRERSQDSSAPDDWVILNNFENPDRPVAVSLAPGDGSRLKHEVEGLVSYLRDAIPRAFRQEDFGHERERLRKEYHQREREVLKELEAIAETHKTAVQQLPNGEILFIPLRDGRRMTPEEVEAMSPEQLEELQSHQHELFEAAGKVILQQAELERQLSSDVREVARSFAAKIILPRVAAIRAQFPTERERGRPDGNEHPEPAADSGRLNRWLDQLTSHMLNHLHLFRDHHEADGPSSIGEDDTDPEGRFLEYGVNLLVDNRDQQRAPVVVEGSPSYRNLFGTIERVVDRSGNVATNFTRIKSGSVLRANGGYLVLDLMEALAEPFVWQHLKRMLKSGALEMEVYDPFSIFSVSGLKPEAIPVNVRVVAVGEPLVYHLLFLHDEDFREIFRVKADFDDELDLNHEAGQLYGRLVSRLSRSEDVRAFAAGAVAVLVREGARLTSSQKKLSTVFSHLADVVREADYWAGRQRAAVVSAEHVELAVRERIGRADLLADRMREFMKDGILLLSVEGTAVGQINVLSVVDLGDYAFGRPSRLTASVGVGTSGIVNIERESRLSGKTFDKGLLILEGYLRHKYAQQTPLALSAGLAMEQSYGGIDGDSASAAELICLLSAIADVPVRQDIAITGSINQFGTIQAIGAVSEKVEGFYDVCRTLGLTGTQGVCIPAANAQHLVLRPEVTQAVREGRFHIWPVHSIDEAASLLTSLPAGDVDEPSTLHGQVGRRLQKMVRILMEQQITTERMIWTPGTPVDLPEDPRPPFPGRDSGTEPA